MAYLQQPSSFLDQASEVSAADLFSSGSEALLFSPLELTVLRMARTESLASARDHGLMRRGLGRFFGLPPVNALADERLEALRRFAIIVRCRSGQLAKHVPEFLARGFTPLQASAVAAGSLV